MGVQLLFELIDDDFASPDQLIDRFAINVSIPAGSTTERTMYPGIFGFATIDMRFTLRCTENFYGPNCDLLCPENRICSNPEGSTNQQNVVVIATSASIGGIVLLLLILLIIITSVALFFHIRKRKVNHADEYKMDTVAAANSENDGVS